MSRMEDMYAALLAGEGRKGSLPRRMPTGRPRNPVTETRYREMAGLGMSGKEAAEALGVSQPAVTYAARRYGLTFKDGRKS